MIVSVETLVGKQLAYSYKEGSQRRGSIHRPRGGGVLKHALHHVLVVILDSIQNLLRDTASSVLAPLLLMHQLNRP